MLKSVRAVTILLMGMIPIPLASQIHYSNHFTREISRCQAEFIEPVEGLYKVKMMKRDEDLNYDLVLFSEEYDFEMRFVLEPKYHRTTPHVDFFTLTTSLALNHERPDIHMNLFEPEEAHTRFNAQWAAYADFIPKRSLTEKSYARLLSIYRQDCGLIHTLLLFNEHTDEKDRRLHSISFQNTLPE